MKQNLFHAWAYVFFCAPFALAHQWPDMFPTPPEVLGFRAQYIDVAEGVPLYVVDRPGDNQSLPALVFVHAIADSWHSWQVLLAELGTERHIVTFDMRGHGYSAKPAMNYTFPMLVNDLKVILDTLDISQIGLLTGHSYGSFLAWYFAGTYPDMVERLLLVSTSDTPWPISFQTQCFETVSQLVARPNITYEFAVQNKKTALSVSRPQPWFFETCIWGTMQMTGPSWGGTLAATCVLTLPEIERTFAKIQARTTIMYADGDVWLSRAMSESTLHRLQPCTDKKLVIVDKEGHAIHWTPRGAGIVLREVHSLLQEPAGCSERAFNMVFM